METLQITKENALKAYNGGCNDVKTVLTNLFGKETFVPKDITDRVKTFEDACSVLGLNPVTVLPQVTTLMTGDGSAIVAFAKLSVIARALNEGWKPDWTNSSQYKYVPWFRENSGFGLSYYVFDGWVSGTYVGSRLCYKTAELAEYAGKQFANEYRDFLTL